MKNKPMIIVIAILFVLSLTGGILGLIKSGDKEETPDEPIIDGEITYVYYLDDVEVTEMPVNTPTVDDEGNEVTNSDYIFSSVSCTNAITGTFNEETWEFETDSKKDGTCKLYFVKSKYEVSIEPTNAQLGPDNDFFIEREGNGVFTIIPADGHEFDKATCTDEKEALWDAEKNTITINSIMKDIACTVIFKTKTLTMDVTVKNGEGTTTEEITYGEKVSAIVTPKSGFENPTITCTNDQKATFKDNTITIDKLTDSTKCTVEFKEKIETYTLKVDLLTSLKITQGNASQTVKKGEAASFTVKPDDGYSIDGEISCGGVVPTKTVNDDGSIKYTFNSISSDVQCTFNGVIRNES